MQVDHKKFRFAEEAPPRYSPPKLSTLGQLTPIQLAMVQSGAADPRNLLDEFIDDRDLNHSKSSTISSIR